MTTLPALPFEIPAVYVLIGASGSGKSTIAAAFPPGWRLSLDDCRHRIADDAGAQDSTAAAVNVFDQVLAGRLARRLPTVVDATNTEPGIRAALVERAHLHQLPAVAIVARTDLASCQVRQHRRPPNRQVPGEVVARQHDGVPTTEQLLREGFAQAHDAADLDLLQLLLTRAAHTGADPLADIRATFGQDLADVFTFDPSPDSTGAFTVAGRQLTVRSQAGDAFDHQWQARLEDDTCPDCEAPLWVKVKDTADLLSVYTGHHPDEPICDHCY